MRVLYADSRIIDLKSVARSYVRVQGGTLGFDVHDVEVRLDLDYNAYCTQEGRFYEEARHEPRNPEVVHSYEQLKWETMLQWDALVAAGLSILPWLEDGQPYANSSELCRRVARTGTLHVFLTRCGHGPCGHVTPDHPMTTSSPVCIGTETLLHNDLFRAVHDAFGHVMSGNKFSLEGELKAAYNHCQMFSPEAAPALLAETLGQICWFYRGPHMLDADGGLLQKGKPGYVAPARRPYSPQKAMLLSDDLISGFEQLFQRRLA